MDKIAGFGDMFGSMGADLKIQEDVIEDITVISGGKKQRCAGAVGL